MTVEIIKIMNAMVNLTCKENISILPPDPVEMLASLHETGHGLSREGANAYIKEVYENRKNAKFFTCNL